MDQFAKESLNSEQFNAIRQQVREAYRFNVWPEKEDEEFQQELLGKQLQLAI